MSTTPLYIDFHVIQTVPPSCINRDDSGSPKTARFGGVTRARVSSQAWKKATRNAFADLLDENELGRRTFYAVDLIAQAILSIDPALDDEKTQELARGALEATGIKIKQAEKESKSSKTGYLLFISLPQAKALAELALDAYRSDKQVDKKQAVSVLNVKQRPVLNAVDIAMYGRMVADNKELNVDAAVQVAHAIGVGKYEQGFDYFTAMDDLSPEDESGAGMIDTVEFTSSTLYRYATVDVFHLYENLGTVKAARRAVETFARAFVQSMPTGKMNSFANRTLPSAVLVQLRETQPVSLVNAFEVPVTAKGDKSQAAVACERLVEQEHNMEAAFGMVPSETHAVCAAPGTQILAELTTSGSSESLDSLVEILGEDVERYLASRGIATEE